MLNQPASPVQGVQEKLVASISQFLKSLVYFTIRSNKHLQDYVEANG